MRLIFKDIPLDNTVYCSIDNSDYVLLNDSHMETSLTKGKHKVSIICKASKDVKCKLAFISRKNPHLICLNISNLSFRQDFSLWVKKDTYFKFCYNLNHEKNFFGCMTRKPIIVCDSDKNLAVTQDYFSIVNNKKMYAVLQLCNILLALLPFTIYITWFICSEFSLIELPTEEWVQEHYFPGHLRPIASIIITGTIEILLFMFYFTKHLLSLKSHMRTIIDRG